MFEKFPKTRPTLSPEIEQIYAVHYKSNRAGATTASSLAQRVESWLHRQVASDVHVPRNEGVATLELGAGTLNQLPYEPGAWPYDIVEPFTYLYEDSLLLERVRNIYSDIRDVPVDGRYDRITSIATLEHVCDLPEVVAESGLLLTDNGVFRAAVPSEGTILWSLGWRLTTGLEFRLKHGLDYGMLMRHEHVNNAREIDDILSYFFRDVECRVLGLTKSISLYRYYECRNPRIERCSVFSARREA